LVLPIIAYILSSTKLEIWAEQFFFCQVARSKEGGKGGSGGKVGEMTQTLYAHINKIKIKN
jgi:hypothetical protein